MEYNKFTQKRSLTDSESNPTRTTEYEVRLENIEESKQTVRKQTIQGIKIPDYREIIFFSVVPGPRILAGVHVSQINMCDRRNIFQIIEPTQESPRNKIRMATGIAMHSYTLKKIRRNPNPDRFDIEKPVQFRDFIFGNIDWYDNEIGVAIEIKTKIVEDPKWKVTPFISHVQQLKDLMAMANTNYGALVMK